MRDVIDFSMIKKYFHISLDRVASPSFTCPGTELLQSDQIDYILAAGREHYKALSLELPASFLGLSLFGFTSTQLLIASQYNVWLDFSLEHLSFELEQHNDHVHANYRIASLVTDIVPETKHSRKRFLEKKFSETITSTLRPLIELIASRANVKPAMIWNQFGARQCFLLDFIEAQERREEVLLRIKQDATILSSLSASLFGMRKNPFQHKPRYIPSPYKENQQLIVRSSCCMYHKRENGTKCYNCPMLTEEQREARRREIMQS